MLPRLNEPQSAGVAGGAAIEGVSDVDDGVGAGDERAAEAVDEAEQCNWRATMPSASGR